MIYYYIIVLVAVVWFTRVIWRNGMGGTTLAGAIANSFWRFVANVKKAGAESDR